MRGDERRVVDAFCAWLSEQGWSVERELEFCDVVATRGDERIYAEVKGRTAAIGLDVDTLFGQLLRRMPFDRDRAARFAVVVPSEGTAAAVRVPKQVREQLRIDLYAVDATGTVRSID